MTLRLPSSHHLLISLVFLLVSATSLPASAGDRPLDEGPSLKVKIGDLDLNTDAGRRELLQRLTKAASRVCDDYAYLYRSFDYGKIYRSCLQDTLAVAVAKIHDEQLSSLLAANWHPTAR